MLNNSNPIGWLEVTGTPFEIGVALGNQGRSAVHQNLLSSEIWADVTDRRHLLALDRMMANTRFCFPEIWEEIQGLAEGLKLPLRDVFAWNCRGDLIHSTPDGCTTIQHPGKTIVLAHNEDGLPFFRATCFILNAKIADTSGFTSFCYPGSLPGHTFGWNSAGLVQTVNNLRLLNVVPEIPRMVISRAVLNCKTMDDAINLFADAPASGGFHMSLAQLGDKRLLSIEFGAGDASVVSIPKRSVHANHALHLSHSEQIITPSSKDRQKRGEILIQQPCITNIEILGDKAGAGLPIWREEPDDPDNENTLATCVISVTQKGLEWSIYGEKNTNPTYRSETEVA